MHELATVAEMKPMFVGGKRIEVLAEGILFVCYLLVCFFWQLSEAVEEF